jgi:hypothetical protein
MVLSLLCTTVVNIKWFSYRSQDLQNRPKENGVPELSMVS